jgi:hypothetical protein
MAAGVDFSGSNQKIIDIRVNTTGVRMQEGFVASDDQGHGASGRSVAAKLKYTEATQMPVAGVMWKREAVNL